MKLQESGPEFCYLARIIDEKGLCGSNCRTKGGIDLLGSNEREL